MKALEAKAFPAMVYALPELAAEECELDELPAGKETKQEHWRAFVHLLQAFERVPAFRQVEGSALLPPLDAARREQLAALGSSFRTVNEDHLARALRGELAPEDIVRPPNAGAPSTAIPARGPLAGVNLLVQPVQRLQQEDEGRIKWKDGDLTVVPKTKKCKDMDEWERGFFRIISSTVCSRGQSESGATTSGTVTVPSSSNNSSKSSSPRRTTVRGAEAQEAVVEAKAAVAEVAAVAVALRMRATATMVATADISQTAISDIQEAPAGAGEVPLVVPGPAVEMDMAPVVETEAEGEATLVERARGEREMEVPTGGSAPERWWAGLRRDEFIPVWDVLGGPRRHDRVPLKWGVERVAPLPVTQTSPDTWRSPEEPWRVRTSTRWPALRAEILQRATIENMKRCGTGENERRCYEEECERVGCAIPTLTDRAHLVAAAFQDWHDVDFLVRCAVFGAGWPSEEIEVDEPYRVPNYVGPEHMDVMRDEITRESEAGHIFLARWRLPLGIIALGMVEKVRKGKVKYRPVNDYSRPEDVGMNARIELDKDEFTTVKEAYGMLRPRYWMFKVDMETACRSKGIASMYWPHQCFEFDGVRWMDARAPFGNRALPGIFMRWTRAIVAWMRARGIPTVEYLDDFFCILETKEQAEEAMLLLVEFLTFLGFKVNSAKCKGPTQLLEFLGVLLSTEGDVCMASIDEERIAVVVKLAGEPRARAARGMVSRRALDSLLGLLAFCSHVVWGLSLYTRRGFNFLVATTGRRMVRLPHQVLEDLAVLERVVRKYNGRRVVLERRLVDERHFATDASGSLGFGRVWEKLFFLLSWADLARLPQQPWFPRRPGCPSNWSINYLELFAVWWAVVLWGHRMSGRTVVVNIDNKSAMYQVGSWWGLVEYLPLLRQIFFTCAKHDIRLQPRYINNKDNLLADLLSRLDMPRFLVEHRAFLRATVWRQNRDDWMVCPVRWEELDQEFGPFTVDSCVAESRANAYCYLSWSRVEDARVQKFDGHNAWGNLPFSIIAAIIRNFLCCKRRQQWGTAACFLVPVWAGNEGWELVKSLPHVFKSPWPSLTGREGWAEELVQELQRETERCKAEALAPETRRCYGTGVQAFVTFCIVFACMGGLDPLLPATDASLCMFITFSSWFVQPDTIKNYLAGVRQLHLQRGHEWVPVAARHTATTLQGVKRCWGRPPKPVMPLTLADLAKMALLISMHDLGQESLWAAILVGFFGLFRKDNLTTGKAGRPGDSALFVMEKTTGKRASVVPMTHDALVAGIKALAERVGLNPASYAGHSLRRGGATAAMRLDVNSLYIKMQGNWKSDCFERYCELDTEQKLVLPGLEKPCECELWYTWELCQGGPQEQGLQPPNHKGEGKGGGGKAQRQAFLAVAPPRLSPRAAWELLAKGFESTLSGPRSAHKLSRNLNLDKWRLNRRWFDWAQEHEGEFTVECFASEISAQLPCCYSQWWDLLARESDGQGKHNWMESPMGPLDHMEALTFDVAFMPRRPRARHEIGGSRARPPPTKMSCTPAQCASVSEDYCHVTYDDGANEDLRPEDETYLVLPPKEKSRALAKLDWRHVGPIIDQISIWGQLGKHTDKKLVVTATPLPLAHSTQGCHRLEALLLSCISEGQATERSWRRTEAVATVLRVAPARTWGRLQAGLRSAHSLRSGSTPRAGLLCWWVGTALISHDYSYGPAQLWPVAQSFPQQGSTRSARGK
ncbi:hypothetical protein CYMTET_57039 [Cymbomonas tetramitiformis]|uniref:Reverse transcriptase domain-containing protein n=1 Tax=Cymbomonas tetramitiformis TaxID=36881 RepID=A0AAE0BAZ0_9CHLO|nr:hypothetical protein CYMTET_57039 [Cymbomonas tetramitiformis]